MRILQVHNHYLHAGGEDVAVRNEATLMRGHGHEVETYATSSEELDVTGLAAKLRTARRSIWSGEARRRLAAAARRCAPDVIHVHNTFPVMSPTALWAGRDVGVPVVQTLHNYRLACANAILLRNGAPCTDCVGGSKLPAVRHRCYRSALGPSLAVAAMQTVHRRVGTYASAVSAYIVLTSFMRDVMVREGLPVERLHVAPNFLPDPPGPEAAISRRAPRRLAFVGRLSHEKGPDLLLDAWASLDPEGWHLDVVGDGPLAATLRDRFAGRSDVRFHGWLASAEVRRVVRSARAVVIPSRWYEGLPMTAVEAYAVGRPVVGPDHGAFPEIVEDGVSGWRFAPGDATDMARVLRHILDLSDETWRAVAQRAHARFEARFSPEAAYGRLVAVYEAARARPAHPLLADSSGAS